MGRLLDLGPDGPLARGLARIGSGRLERGRLRVVTFGGAIAFALAVVVAVGAMHVSSTPDFCGSCHIMKPYYESWRASKHAGIACVECHISPGITAEFRKKFEALSMVAKYFTGTYSTNPWAEVDDAACLRCHERRLLEGKEVFHGVLFDHRPHLTESRRGLQLRCTSCHSQIVQGSHIAVTTSTCALCHFKGQPVNAGYGRCRACHEVPERVVSAGGTAFDHSQVRRLDMDCALCHGNVVRGEGNVPRERCLTCHNEPDRLAEFENQDLLHLKHVSEHKVDCMNCHLTMEHGTARDSTLTRGMSHQADCAACHGQGHGAQEALYSGVGGRGVERMPSPMFTAGVTCEGCHNPAFQTAVPAAAGPIAVHTQRAGDVSCMACHGPGYRKIFHAWKEGVDARAASLGRLLDQSANVMAAAPPAAWQDARYNHALVVNGHGIHNVNFAYALMEKSWEQLNQARRARGLAAVGRPWPAIASGAAGGECLTCHRGIENQEGAFAGRAFAHAPHVSAAKLDCATCHRPHAERAPGEVVRFGADGCLTCHHTSAPQSVSDCTRCHADPTTRTVESFRGPFSHKAHGEAGLECAQCHTPVAGDPRPAKSVCTGCHE